MKKDKSGSAHVTQDFPVVGIGASAGGLDAFKRLLGAIPRKSGMAYVLVQHLSANHISNLPEILSRVATIPVHEIIDEIQLVPDHIYIIPENKMLIAVDGKLKLCDREPGARNRTIDTFFKSLA
jgi:two-component system CheB/CheR fusion protein